MWPSRTFENIWERGIERQDIYQLTLLINDDQPRAEDAEEAGADEDGHGDEEHEHVDLVRLLQVEVGRNKVTLAGCVVAGESRFGRVVAPVVAKVSEP